MTVDLIKLPVEWMIKTNTKQLLLYMNYVIIKWRYKLPSCKYSVNYIKYHTLFIIPKIFKKKCYFWSYLGKLPVLLSRSSIEDIEKQHKLTKTQLIV